MTSTLTKSFGVLVAAAVLSATAAKAEETAKYEPCFGIAKAGQNDCKSSTHVCAGKSTQDRDPHAFVDVPAGTCSKIAGGSTTEPAADAKKK